MKYPSLADLVGNTPLVDLSALVSIPGVTLLGKLEGNNPGSSVKDRAARSMIQGALSRGEIQPGMKLIEPTSGNTGIALAMMASSMGIAIELVMPENSTQERIDTMQAFGAVVTLTSAKGSMEEAIDVARDKCSSGDYKMLDQFSNPDNWGAHYATTGPEIFSSTRGEITHFVSAMGTTGTIMGTSRYLKEQNNAIEIVGVQPADGARIPGIRRWPEAYLPKIFEPRRVDRIIDVSEQDAVAFTRKIAQGFGVFAGMSSGGAVCAATRLAETLDAPATIVTIICDRGDRYLSSNLFKS